MPDTPEFPEEPMPLPFGIKASGEPLNDLQPDDWKKMDRTPGLRPRQNVLAFAEGVDPMDLTSAGWGIVFARDANPEVRKALLPFMKYRQDEVNNDVLYQDFSEGRGIRKGESARGWVTRHGVDFMDVEPSNGVPLYLLLVGSPEEIPFEFQYSLDGLWNVGRLDFDTPAQYAAYADHVMAYEKAAQVTTRKQAALWNVKNPGDQATGLLHNLVAKPLMEGQGSIKPLGTPSKTPLLPMLAEAATKSALLDVLRGVNGTPAFLFTGSHGVAFPDLDEAQRRELQGALLCQGWSRGEAPKPDQYLTGEEVLAEAKVAGMIQFLFACYGGGCPAFDNYDRGNDGQPVPLMSKPVTARVPQAMLQKGALAVLAHIDRAWSYGFQTATGKGQYQGFRSVMDRILNGERIGQATDSLNRRESVLASELLDLTRRKEDNEPIPNSVISNRWVARNDARNYLVLGDPAVKLRTKDMAP